MPGDMMIDVLRGVGLVAHDEAVAAQAASLCRRNGIDLASAAFAAALQDSSEPVRRGFHRALGKSN
jgi:hypothetical protein